MVSFVLITGRYNWIAVSLFYVSAMFIIIMVFLVLQSFFFRRRFDIGMLQRKRKK
mgnify:CR=1 FL=1